MENIIILCITSIQDPNFKTTAFTKVVKTAIRRCDDQTFDDMSEESEKQLSALSLRNKQL